jgi:hypothetical protein
MYSRRASRIREERLTRARLAAPFVARSNSESNTTWMVSILWKILHSLINSQTTRIRVRCRGSRPRVIPGIMHFTALCLVRHNRNVLMTRWTVEIGDEFEPEFNELTASGESLLPSIRNARPSCWWRAISQV